MKRNPTNFRGFTLVEVLTATTILSILFAIMFGILQQTSRGWQAANRRVEASQVARLAMDQIASDLENSVAVTQRGVRLPQGTVTNLAYGFVHSNAPPMNWDSLPSSINISMPNDYLFVVTPYPPSQNLGSGDLCEVGYIPIYVATSRGYFTMRGGRYVLLRHLPMTNAGSGTGTGARASVTNAQPVNDFLTNSAAWETTPAVVDLSNRLPFVDNCIKFDVQFLYSNSVTGQITRTNFWGRPSTNAAAVGGWVNLPPGASPGLPLAAVIQMCVIDDKTAERIWRIRGMRALDMNEKTNLPTNWSGMTDPVMRRILQESVLTLERTVYFKNAGR